MPLGTLRKKASARDLHRRSQAPKPSTDTPPLPTTTLPATVSPSRHASPLQSGPPAPPRRPSSSHHPAPSPRPQLPRRPSSPRSAQLLGVPRTRNPLKSASEADMNARYRAQARRSSSPLRDHEAAPPPTIGITDPNRNGVDSEKSTRRRTIRPLGTNLASSVRASSYNINVPSSRASDVGTQTSPRVWQSGLSTSGRDHNELLVPVDDTSHSPIRYSESSAARREFQSTPRTISSANPSSKTSQFFRFGRKKKQPEPLFPLPVRISPPTEPPSKSQSVANSDSPTHSHSFDDDIPPVPPIPSSATAASGKPSVDLGGNGSAASGHSSPPVTIQFNPDTRSRAGTMNSSTGHPGSERIYTPLPPDSGRNSTASTTLGRNSIAGLRNFVTSRIRYPSEPHTPHGHGSPGGALAQSANTSFALSRETLVVPDREEGESAGKYYARLETEMPKRFIAMALSKSPDQFNKDVLRSLLRTFKFYEEPMDMSVRKYLWECNLSGEAQQIDRVLNAFAERYHECNPHIFANLDQAVFLAYSLIILHSDLFNANNKTKMQRREYQKNTRDQGIPPEILGYFYDNIQYTEFIQQNADEEEKTDSKSKAAGKKARRVKERLAAPEPTKNGKVDPYVVIIDDKYRLDTLKPVLKDTLNLDDTYSYMGTANRFDVLSMRAAFARFGTLQIASPMSRPGAFAAKETMHHPFESAPGVVDIKVAKVGILWRKSAKRKRTRSPWQEWGAILTASQMMFFRNVNWVKNLCHQVETHQKQGNGSIACVFRPPLENLTFEGKVATNEGVALLDTSYRRHKYAFVVARRGFAVGGSDLEQHFEETLLADSEADMNDWIAKFNYASTHKSSNVRMHSWHPGCRVESIIGSSGSSDGAKQSSEADSNQLDAQRQSRLSPVAQVSLMRTQMIKEKLATTTEELESKLETVDEYIRTARHLEILAPLNEKTRGELLSFGVRLSHNIRWSRFEVSRLKCHRDILFREMQEDESSTSTRGMGVLDADDRIFGLNGGRQNDVRRASKDEAQSNEKRWSDVKKASPRLVQQDANEERSASYRNSNIFESIDEAFATPPETLAHLEGPNAGNLKLHNLSHVSSATNIAQPPSSPDLQSTSSVRPSSVSSTASRPPPPVGSTTPTQSVHENEYERRPSTASGSELGAAKGEAASSPIGSNRLQARRSLQRTLREPRDALSQHSSRSNRNRKAKERDSQAGDTDDNGSIQGPEGLTRRRGSFTVHGKKASVITIPEWDQKRSTEERLRLRKQLAADGSRRRSQDIDLLTEDEDGSVVMDKRLSLALSSEVAEDSEAG